MTKEQLLKAIEDGLAGLNAGGGAAPVASTVLDRLLAQYRANLNVALQKLVADIKVDPEQCIPLVQAFLTSQWVIIKGTALDYTAQHEHQMSTEFFLL
jgi:hypothetical protein